MFYAITPRLCVPSLAPCVLVVEDDAMARNAMIRILTLAGFRTLAAETLAGAYERLPFQPDVVLTDLSLPDGSGVSLIRRIRERGEPITIGVVSGAGDELIDEANSLRPDAIFRKPLDVSRLIEWLKTADTARVSSDVLRVPPSFLTK
jgi:DNA-binding response OmpR family regulator